MKRWLTTAAIVVALAAPAFGQGGNIGGSESRGEPLNSSYRASGVDRATGHTPGRKVHAKTPVKKKRPQQATSHTDAIIKDTRFGQ
jgi:hypothetical protein